jgi:hypothetical protein
MRKNFWYSIKQKERQMFKSGWRYCAKFARFDGYRLAEYTMCAPLDSLPPEKWDDVIYLGEGLFDHLEDIQSLLRMS